MIHLLSSYGYLAVAAFVMVESAGIPFPGETMLLLASVYAGSSHNLAIGLVIAAAAVGAIAGDNLGFLAGHEGGFRLVRRYGRYVRLTDRRLKLGQYLFLKHGAKVVFFGRFVGVLRTWSAFLAGTNRMPWRRFLLANGAGGIIWASGYGLLGYFVGSAVHRLSSTLALSFGIAGALSIAGVIIFMRKNEARLEEVALRTLAVPLDEHRPAA